MENGMTDGLGGESVAGGHMKTDYGWYGGGNGSNSSGFSGLPGGYRYYDDLDGYFGYFAKRWSLVEFLARHRRRRYEYVYRGNRQLSGISVPASKTSE